MHILASPTYGTIWVRRSYDASHGRKDRGRCTRHLGLIFILAVVLGGCTSPWDFTDQESPPPKQPNCPRVNLDGLRLPDGTLADVRIVQVHRTKLYIPTSWLKASWLLVDFEKAEYGKRTRLSGDTGPVVWTARRDYNRMLTPDAHLEECSGIVHLTSDDLSGYNGIRIQFHRWDGVRVDATNVSPASMVTDVYLTHAGGGKAGTTATGAAAMDWRPRDIEKSVDIGRGWRAVDLTTFVDVRRSSDDLNAWFIVYQENVPWGTSAEQWVLPDVMFRYEAPIGRNELGRWRALRAPMRDLAEWLVTPPAKRDNERVFTLGAAER